MTVADPETPVVPEAAQCPRCGASLRPDQDWCLNCGNAVTTRVAGTRAWRTPVAIVAAVLLLAAAGLLIAFLEISNDADRLAQATPTPAPAATEPPVPTATPTTAPEITPSPGASPAGSPPAAPTVSPTPTPGATTTPAPTGTVATWPAGEEAWTVILMSSQSKADADRRAEELVAEGKSVGVLDSDDFESLRGGYWVVFSGQYDTRNQAEDAAEALGAPAAGAYARFVDPR